MKEEDARAFERSLAEKLTELRDGFAVSYGRRDIGVKSEDLHLTSLAVL
jgi:hypothetical protein